MIHTLHTILLLVYILVCCVLTVIVLMQEGKQAGLTGAISGAAETYWGKNKGRSMEGGLELATRIHPESSEKPATKTPRQHYTKHSGEFLPYLSKITDDCS